MTITAACQALRARIAAQSANFTAGTNLFVGFEIPPGPGVPSECTFIAPLGNPSPVQRLHDGANRVWTPQVIHRSGEDEQNAGQTLINELFTIVEAAKDNIAGFFFTEAAVSAPIPSGKGDDGLYRWSFDAMMWERET